MTKSDSLDNITLDSDEIRTIEKFENNYYKYKKTKLQNGGNYKLETNIGRLFSCYLLSKNQQYGGGQNNSNLTNSIQNRLNNKIAELIVHKNYFNVNLEGGNVDMIEKTIKNTAYEYIKKKIDENLINRLKEYIDGIDIKKIISDYVNQQISAISKGAMNTVNNVTKGVVDLHKGVSDLTNQGLGAVGSLFQGKATPVKK